MRHKDFGIWQSWSWAEQLDEIRALALGLQALGLKPATRIAIIGANRPRLYWTFAAAQSLGAVPVPVYADAVADEMAYVLDHAGVRFAVVQDQEQVDKIRVLRRENPVADARDLRRTARPAATIDQAGLHAFADVQQRGEAPARCRPARSAERWEEGIRAASGDDISVMLYTSGTTGRSKGVMIKAARRGQRGARHGDIRQAERDATACWPICRSPGSAIIISTMRKAMSPGFCMNCPESPDTVAQDLREIGADLLFRAAARLRDAC